MKRYDFKGDFTNSVFRLMGRIFIIVFVVQLITSLLNFIFSDLIVDPLLIQQMQADLEGIDPSNLDELIEVIKDVMGSFISQLNFGVITIATLLSLLISLITYNIVYNGIKHEIASGDNSFGSAISNILDVRIIKYFFINLIIGLATLALILLLFLTGSFILILIGCLFIIPIAVWYTLANSAVGLGNLSLGKSLGLASSSLSFARIFKVLGIGIIVLIATAIAGAILGLCTSFLDPFSTIGRIANLIVGLATGVPLTAFILAGFSGLYYRYTDSQKFEEEFLVTD